MYTVLPGYIHTVLDLALTDNRNIIYRGNIFHLRIKSIFIRHNHGIYLY
jgi:hypothetical protein